jgi:hypothetical protein
VQFILLNGRHSEVLPGHLGLQQHKLAGWEGLLCLCGATLLLLLLLRMGMRVRQLLAVLQHHSLQLLPVQQHTLV